MKSPFSLEQGYANSNKILSSKMDYSASELRLFLAILGFRSQSEKEIQRNSDSETRFGHNLTNFIEIQLPPRQKAKKRVIRYYPCPYYKQFKLQIAMRRKKE